ncbi:hypothetical protein D3C77_757080 [compost metagenome]
MPSFDCVAGAGAAGIDQLQLHALGRAADVFQVTAAGIDRTAGLEEGVGFFRRRTTLAQFHGEPGQAGDLALGTQGFSRDGR